MQDFLISIGVDKELEFVEGKATAFLKDSNEYARTYTLLSNSDELEIISEDTLVNKDIMSVHYLGRNYEIVLSGDMTRDIYKLTIEEVI